MRVLAAMHSDAKQRTTMSSRDFVIMLGIETDTITLGTLPPITGDEWDGCIAKLGPDGMPIWITSLTGPGYQGLSVIEVLPDGTFYVSVSRVWFG